jgi:regulator of RNase E activity RraB
VNDPEAGVDLGDPRRHVWLLLVGVVLLVGVGVTVYRARSVPKVSPNEAVRNELVKAGVDPSSELAYEHFLFFASKSRATIAVTRLRDDFEVSGPVESPDSSSGLDWSVTARQKVAMDLTEIDQLTRRLEELATGLGGVYDGWDVDLTGVTPAISA